MQAIITKYIPPTNTKGARIKASCARGSVVIPCGDCNRDHFKAKEYLVGKFAAEDQKEYGTPPAGNPWLKKTVAGVLPSGDVVHVFVKE